MHQGQQNSSNWPFSILADKILDAPVSSSEASTSTQSLSRNLEQTTSAMQTLVPILDPDGAKRVDHVNNSRPDLSNNGNNLDSRMSLFIRQHLMRPLEPDSTPAAAAVAATGLPAKRAYRLTDSVAGELDKVLRVLAITAKLSHKLTQTNQAGTARVEPEARSPVARDRHLASEQVDLVGQNELSRSASGANAINKLALARLVKKTDWNALFVKLAKVFLQYFLDLILNDMFGTTGELPQTRPFSSISLL